MTPEEFNDRSQNFTDIISSGSITQFEEWVSALYALVISHEIRDFKWDACGFYLALIKAMEFSWTANKSTTSQVSAYEEQVWSIWDYCFESPEFIDDEASRCVTLDWAALLLDRIVMYATASDTIPKQSLRCAKNTLHWVYSSRIDFRPQLRVLIGTRAIGLGAGHGRGSDAGRSRNHVAHLLEILSSIINGFTSMGPAQLSLLQHVLLPLHSPSDMIEWRDQIPVLQLYHEALVKCVVRFVEKDREVGARSINDPPQNRGEQSRNSVLLGCIHAILRTWPKGSDANTPKEVLFLHEIEILTGMATTDEALSCFSSVLTRISRSVGSESDNIRPAQRALQMFKSPLFMNFLSHNYNAAVAQLLPVLYRGGKLSWNPTVNRMTGLALLKLQGMDVPAFTVAANVLFSGLSAVNEGRCIGDTDKHVQEDEKCGLKRGRSVSGQHEHKALHGIDAAAATRPPLPHAIKIDSASAELHPPIHPANRAASNAILARPSMSTLGRSHGSAVPPPVTITGMAPWAMGGITTMRPDMNAARGSVGMRQVHAPHAVMPPRSTINSLPGLALHPARKLPRDCDKELCVENERADVDENGDDEIVFDGHAVEGVGIRAIERFIQTCTAAKQLAANEDWNSLQAAELPSLLPNLRFHDIVFGHVLGEGAFSVVKYARKISRHLSQSQWSEFAVKIVSSSRLTELSYDESVAREIAVLHLFTHPGISRLLSAFTYTGNIYIVLEYASRGDLHSYLLAVGRGSNGIGHLATRFIVGEIAAALLSIHDLGFSFNDLKPENVLITQIGHVKLTDFGACRAITSSAGKMLEGAIATATCLRDGDWRPGGAAAVRGVRVGSHGTSDSCDAKNDADEPASSSVFDQRCEGTPAYLPPEVLGLQLNTHVISPQTPSRGSDVWALGCLAYFCLVGRPLFYGDRERVLVHMKHELSLSDGVLCYDGAVGDLRPDNSKISFSADCAHIDKGHLKSRIASLGSHATQFLKDLMCIDPTKRLAMHEVALHQYLTHGPVSDVTVLSEPEWNDCTLLSPLTLHASLPVPLPAPTTGSEAGSDDPQWARRQFSVLWAPMPHDYNVNQTVGSDSKSGAGRVMGKYVMSNIVETALEAKCSFVA